MASVAETYVRSQLQERRRRLEVAATTPVAPAELGRLLQEVDAALARLEDGSYGLCDVCHDPIESERLLSDPLVRFCLDHLTPAEQAALQQDLELSARIQRGLLPPTQLLHDGWELALHWEPAGIVSGDFVDALPAPDGSLLVAFGDIAGKGVAAALLMSNLRAAFRHLAPHESAVEDIVTRANHLFRESTLSPFFATLVVMRLGAAGELSLANAGHCLPLLLSDGAISTLPSTGLPVGAFAASRYTGTTRRMKVGDTLLLYTDGLSEARDGGDAEYGAERVAAVLGESGGLSPAELVATLRRDLDRHLAGHARHDDLTLLAVRRQR